MLHTYIHFGHYTGARNVKTLKVQCNNLENGCQWVGELGKLEKHMEFCDVVHIRCPNACTIIQTQTVEIQGKDLLEHITHECPRRKHRCPHCEEMGEYGERTTSHLETCPMMIVQCSNHDCDAAIFIEAWIGSLNSEDGYSQNYSPTLHYVHA